MRSCFLVCIEKVVYISDCFYLYQKWHKRHMVRAFMPCMRLVRMFLQNLNKNAARSSGLSARSVPFAKKEERRRI